MPRNRISIFISAIAISLLSLWNTAVQAQKRETSPKVVADTIPTFRGIAVSADLLGAVQWWLSDYGQYEAALRVNLKDRYFPILEMGIGKADASDVSTRLHFTTSAPYLRIGCDFNMLKNKHDIYRLYAGFRYAITSYKFDVNGSGVTDPVWGEDAVYEAKDVKGNYQWIEAVAGVDVKISGPVHLGWSVRYRRRLFYSDGSLGNTWYVPGFGRQGNSRLGGTFNLIFEF